MVLDDAIMCIPCIDVLVDDSPVPELYGAHASFDQPASHQALSAKRFANLVVKPVEALGFLALIIDVDRFRCAPLHPESQFIRTDASSELANSRVFLDIILVHASQLIQFRALLGLG